MRVSVIVPLYNKAPYVLRSLDSIRAQTFTSFEVIVVDDGSTDGGDRLVDAYPDERFRLVRQQNAGPGAARNRGIGCARGEFLAFLDADDVWFPGYLEHSLAALTEQAPEAAAVSSGYIDYPQGVSREPMWRARGFHEGLQRVTPHTPPLKFVHMVAYMSPCNTVARAEAIRRWGGFYSKEGCRYGEDAILWLKFLLNETAYFHLRPLTAFYRDAAGLSKNLKRMRPLEPFLLDPEEAARVCPPELRELLRRFYAIRASKTAAILGYWGQHREARKLLRRYVSLRDCFNPFFVPGLVGCTPLAGLLGAAWRRLR